jgi:hypothetical protein
MKQNCVSIDDTALLTPDDLERETGVPKSSWAKHGMTGYGPSYLKIGRRVFYRRRELNSWLDAHLVNNTSQ